MAQILADWAIQNTSASAMDPSFGGGIFFTACQKRLLALGQDTDSIKSQLYGVDLDAASFKNAGEMSIVPDNLIQSDFFEIQPEDHPLMDAIIGNPPYVRYQQWDAKGSRAHSIAAELGYPLTKLASLWAPFVLQMSRFLKVGGRLALVLPAELLYATYARPIQSFLSESFTSVRLALFETSVFEGAQEEIVLLFAEGFQQGTGPIALLQFHSLDDFDTDRLQNHARVLEPAMPLFALLADEEQVFYKDFCKLARPLSELASLDIGIVTGGNKFFIVKESVAVEGGFHPDGLAPILSKAGDVAGACVSESDYMGLLEADRPAHLISLNKSSPGEVLASFEKYLREGEDAGINGGYKCRVRYPWWAVPMLEAPDLFLTYVNGAFPRLAYNAFKARSTNSIHNLRMVDGKTNPQAFAVAFYNAGTLLSAELCGRSYGGGALKLEPSEGGRLMIPSFSPNLAEHLAEVDQLVREGQIDELLDLTDSLVLHPLGIGAVTCSRLRESWKKLQGRRRGRGG
jgi:adenine-specific DNA methylase